MEEKKSNKKEAVIRIAGKQYLVSEGMQIEVNRLEEKPGAKVSPEVLLVTDSKETKVGTPTLDTKVQLTVVANKKGEKISGMRFKAKSRYRRRYGYRSSLTVLSVDKVA